MSIIGNLIIGMSLNTGRFNSDVSKAKRQTKSMGTSMRRSMNNAAAGFQKAQMSLSRLRTGLVTLVAAGGLALFTKRAIEAADEIGKTADVIGITTGALQEYRHAATLAGVETSLMQSVFQAFAKRVGEAKEGVGPLTTFMKKYDDELLRVIVNTKSTEEALALVFKRMGEATEATERAAIANAAFSRSGLVLVNMVKGGKDSLDAMRREARDLGLVINDNLIRNAEKANDQLAIMSSVLKTQLTAALISMSPWITEVGQKFADLARTWAEANSPAGKIKATIKELEEELVKLKRESETSAFGGVIDQILFGFDPGGSDKIEETEQRLRALRGVLESINDIPSPGTGDEGGEFEPPKPLKIDPDIAKAKSLIASARTDLERYSDQLKEVRRLSAKGLLSDPETIRLEAKAFDDYANSFDKITEKAEETKMEFEKLEIAIRGWGEEFTNQIVDAKLNFEDLADSIVKDLARIVVQKKVTKPLLGLGLMGLGALPGLGSLGALAPAFFAMGGDFSAGQPMVVGERGPELIVPNRGGTVIPNGAGGVVQNINVNAQNAAPGMEVKIRQAVAEGARLGYEMVHDDFRRNGPIRASV